MKWKITWAKWRHACACWISANSPRIQRREFHSTRDSSLYLFNTWSLCSSPNMRTPGRHALLPLRSLVAVKLRVFLFKQSRSLAATSITHPVYQQVAFTVSILTAKAVSRFTATWPQTEGDGQCSREGETAPKTSTWAGVSTKRALDSWVASSGWGLTRSIAWRPAERASCEWR